MVWIRENKTRLCFFLYGIIEHMFNIFKKRINSGLKYIESSDPRDVQTSQYLDSFGSEDKDWYGADLEIINKLKVEDQKSHGSCVGQTFAKILEYYDEKNTDLSARSIYVGTDKLYEEGNRSGLNPLNACKFLNKEGAVSESIVPDDNRLNSDDYFDFEIHKNAKRYKIDSYAYVPQDNVEELKKAFEKHEVLGLFVSNGKYNKRSGKITSGGLGGHAMFAYGMETTADGWVIHLINSWGENWGKDGHGSFEFDSLKNGKTRFFFMAVNNIPKKVVANNKNKFRTVRYRSRGETVRILQLLLGIVADGIFGKITLAHVKGFQLKNGLIPDGIVGPNTWSKLLE